MVTRLLKHLLVPDWMARRAFPSAALQRLEHAIRDSERRHRGEIRFAIEGGLAPAHLRTTTHLRARLLFAQLGVWDTEENSGVLIYVQLVDRRIEIVADRGIAQKVSQAQWDAVCRAMEQAFKRDEYESGALEAIRAVTDILARHFPAGPANANELPDRPVVL